MNRWCTSRMILTCLMAVSCSLALAQEVVTIDDGFEQHIFTYGEIELLEDPLDKFSLGDVQTTLADRFVKNPTYKPENYNVTSAYWYRVRIRQAGVSHKHWVIEFFDQTIDRIDFYIPADSNRHYTHHTLGDVYSFATRPVKHKNFVFPIPTDPGNGTYYFKVKSRQKADVIVVLRAMDWLFQYATNEYFFFGIFYGMILVFSFYNLLMYAAVREIHYLYYILYLLSIGLYEMSADGIAFQYLWPESPGWNQVAAGYLLYFGSTFALLFVNSFLHLRENYPTFFKFLAGIFIFRTVFLILSVTALPQLFSYRIIDVLPFAGAFLAAIYSLYKQYRPARFVVVGYTFLFYGIISRLLLYINVDWKPFGELSHYGIGFCFIMEMVFLSFAISDKIRILRKEKEEAQAKIILQLRENQQLQDDHNKNLEGQVLEKTRDLLEQSHRIEHQNTLLQEANTRLGQQSDEIARMNLILSEDNLQLKENVAHVTEARILSKDVDFEEFSQQYPDDASCLKFLADLKWKEGFSCHRCQHVNYGAGRSAFGRRCSKCGYEESATANTILQSTHLPINKAFYLIFLVYSSKGNISSYKLSEILDIRQSTCWLYSSKIKKTIREKRKNGSLNESMGWSSLLLSDEQLARVESEKNS